MSVLAEIAIRSARGRFAARRGALTGFEAQIAAGTDDAVEYLFTDSVVLDGSPIPLGFDGAIGLAEGKTLAAFRFPGVTLAQGETVSLARLRFVSTNGNTTPVVLRVWCEAADNSAALTAASGSLSARAKTTAFLDWAPPAWSVNEDSEGTRTDDLAPVVQEVINRPGWQYGNALTFLVELSAANTDTESPRRRAYSYEADPNAAARVSFNAIELPTPQPPAFEGDFEDEYGAELFGLSPAEFNPDDPHLADGTPFTEAMGTFYDAAMYWVLNTANSNSSFVNPESRWGNSNSYSSGRGAQVIQTRALMLYRLTRDKRSLDRLYEGYQAHKTHRTVAWSGHDPSLINSVRSVEWAEGAAGKTGNPWSPYAKWLSQQGTGWTRGTDLLYLDTGKLAAVQAEYAWLMHLSRNAISPKGYDYGAEAEYWTDVVVQFLKAWSETSSADWTLNYRGDEWNGGASDRRRAPWGEYPVFHRDGSHSAMQTIPQHHYIGLLGLHRTTGAATGIPNPQAAFDWALTAAARMRSFTMVECSSTFGDSITLPRNNWFKGGDNQAAYATYTNYVALMFAWAWQTGAYRGAEHFDLSSMRRLARAYADMHNMDGSTKKNLNADVTKCGLTGTNGAGRTVGQNQINNFAAISLVADGGAFTKLDAVHTAVQNASGGYASNNSGLHAASQFARAAHDLIGDLG